MLFSITLIITFFYTNLKAADGCYVGGVLYTSHTKTGAFFYRSPGNITANCGITGNISGSCRLYNSGNIGNNVSYTSYASSYSSNISVITCPLDDKIWLLFLAITLGIFFKFRLIRA